MSVALIFPRLKYGEHSPPLGLGYLAAMLEGREYSVSIIDLTFEKSFGYLEKELRQLQPELVGITCQTTFADDAFKAARIVRKLLPRTTIIFGGPHATVMPEQTMQESGADIVVVGEGEEVLLELVEKISSNESVSTVKGIYYKDKGTVSFSGHREFIDDLDRIPFPARHLFDKCYFEYPEITMINSRGCPFHCSFCQPTLKKLFGKKVRLRSPENVTGEIEFILKNYGNKIIRFHDDTFTWDREWVKNLCGLIKKKNLNFWWNCKSRIDVIDRELVRSIKDAGCRRLDLGIESGSQRVLSAVLNKGITIDKIKEAFRICAEEGIAVLAFIMVGAPTETPRDILDTISLLEEIHFDGLHVSLFTPFPGTHIFDYAKNNELICANSWADYDFYTAVSLKSKYFTSREIKNIRIVVEKGCVAHNLYKEAAGPLRFMFRHPRTFFHYLPHWLRLKRLKKLLFKKQQLYVNTGDTKSG